MNYNYTHDFFRKLADTFSTMENVPAFFKNEF